MTPNNFYETDDGAFLYYEVHGEGTPLILLHGWTASMRVFDKNVPELSKHYQVITVDYRGAGYSSKLLEGHTPDRYCRDIRGLVEHLGLKEYFMGGWSMSVAISLRYVELFGEDGLLGMILIDGTPQPFSVEAWNGKPVWGNFNIDAVINKLNRYNADFEGEAKSNAVRFFKDKESANSLEGIECIAREALKTPPFIASAIFSGFTYLHQVDTLKSLTVPLLVIAQSANSVRSEFEAACAEKSPYKEVVSLDAGHALFWEKYEGFNAAVLGFMKKALECR